jgi:hypothetical protein
MIGSVIPRARPGRGSGWFLAGYVGVAGFFVLEATLRDEGGGFKPSETTINAWLIAQQRMSGLAVLRRADSQRQARGRERRLMLTHRRSHDHCRGGVAT